MSKKNQSVQPVLESQIKLNTTIVDRQVVYLTFTWPIAGLVVLTVWAFFHSDSHMVNSGIPVLTTSLLIAYLTAFGFMSDRIRQLRKQVVAERAKQKQKSDQALLDAQNNLGGQICNALKGMVAEWPNSGLVVQRYLLTFPNYQVDVWHSSDAGRELVMTVDVDFRKRWDEVKVSEAAQCYGVLYGKEQGIRGAVGYLNTIALERNLRK